MLKITKIGNLKKMFQVVESKVKQKVHVEELNGLRTHINEKIRFKGWSYYSVKVLVYHEQGSGSNTRTQKNKNKNKTISIHGEREKVQHVEEVYNETLIIKLWTMNQSSITIQLILTDNVKEIFIDIEPLLLNV